MLHIYTDILTEYSVNRWSINRLMCYVGSYVQKVWPCGGGGRHGKGTEAALEGRVEEETFRTNANL